MLRDLKIKITQAMVEINLTLFNEHPHPESPWLYYPRVMVFLVWNTRKVERVVLGLTCRVLKSSDPHTPPRISFQGGTSVAKTVLLDLFDSLEYV